MATTSTDVRGHIIEDVEDRPPLLTTALSLIRRQPLGSFGLLIVIVMIITGAVSGRRTLSSKITVSVPAVMRGKVPTYSASAAPEASLADR